jgi:hypothetical protein
MIAATALLASKPVPLHLPECFKAPVQPGLRAVPETRTSVPTTGKPLGYVADEPVVGEPVSGRTPLLLTKMQGDFDKMQRGANCNRANSGHFSITCIASPYSRSRETVML